MQLSAMLDASVLVPVCVFLAWRVYVLWDRNWRVLVPFMAIMVVDAV